jgi:hypothetical protein
VREGFCGRTAFEFIGAGFGYEIVRAQQGFKRAGIGPRAVENFIGQLAFVDVEVIHVSDFEFTAA